MTSTITCNNCQDVHPVDWTITLDDSGTYTFCPACKTLSWAYPEELTPYYQEGFRCEISTGVDLEIQPLELLIAEVTKRVDEAGFRFEFDLANWIDIDADRTEQLKSLEGVIVGIAQLEMDSWPFNPEYEGKDEDSDVYMSTEALEDPQNLKEIVEKAIADMFNNLGGDGYYAERQQINDALKDLTYNGNPVEVTVDGGEWTGNG